MAKTCVAIAVIALYPWSGGSAFKVVEQLHAISFRFGVSLRPKSPEDHLDSLDWAAEEEDRDLSMPSLHGENYTQQV